MAILSINLGQTKTYAYRGRTIKTAIFKSPVNNKVKVKEDGIVGDKQADLRYHGGIQKAIYAYSFDHYDYWKEKLGIMTLPFGSFGENLTIEGYTESNVRLGDIFQVGNIRLQVTVPREPCKKLNFRFDNNQMIKLFNASGNSGYYLKVLENGIIKTGDKFEKLIEAEGSVTIEAYNKAIFSRTDDKAIFERVLNSSWVPREKIERINKNYEKLKG